MNAIRQTQALNRRELENATPISASWHTDYRDTAWVYVGGLPLDLSEGDVLIIFSQFGNPTHLNLIRDRETGKSRGFGFLKYEDQRSCDLAVDNLGGAEILGRILRVDHTRYKWRDGEQEEDYDAEVREREQEAEERQREGSVASDNSDGRTKRKRVEDGADRNQERRRIKYDRRDFREMIKDERDSADSDNSMNGYADERRREIKHSDRDRYERKTERRHRHRHRHPDEDEDEDAQRRRDEDRRRDRHRRDETDRSTRDREGKVDRVRDSDRSTRKSRYHDGQTSQSPDARSYRRRVHRSRSRSDADDGRAGKRKYSSSPGSRADRSRDRR